MNNSQIIGLVCTAVGLALGTIGAAFTAAGNNQSAQAKTE